jgi:hypothetical protein
MRSLVSWFLVVCLPGVAVVHLDPGRVAGQPTDPRIERILKDWHARQSVVQRIGYAVTGQSIIPKGSRTDEGTGAPHPEHDVSQEVHAAVLLDFREKRYRLTLNQRLYHSTKHELFPRLTTAIFDSKDFLQEIPREANDSPVYPRLVTDDDVMIVRSAERMQPLSTLVAQGFSPLLLAHGIVPKFMESPAFGKKYDPDDFQIHGEGIHAGKNGLVLRTYPEKNITQASFDEYWVDGMHDNTVVRQSAYVNKTLRVDQDVTYQQTKWGWLPDHWVTTTRDPPNKIIGVAKLKVQEFIVDPAVEAKDFQVEIRPGMNVRESTLHQSASGLSLSHRSFRVGPDGHWNEIVNGVGQRFAWSWRQWLGLVLAASVALVVGLFVYRRAAVRKPTRQATV